MKKIIALVLALVMIAACLTACGGAKGATLKDGKIYSLEGFGHDPRMAPAIRVIDLEAKREESYTRFADFGLTQEPEFIDFAGEVCYYGDNPGHLYILEL